MSRTFGVCVYPRLVSNSLIGCRFETDDLIGPWFIDIGLSFVMTALIRRSACRRYGTRYNCPSACYGRSDWFSSYRRLASEYEGVQFNALLTNKIGDLENIQSNLQSEPETLQKACLSDHVLRHVLCLRRHFFFLVVIINNV